MGVSNVMQECATAREYFPVLSRSNWVKHSLISVQCVINDYVYLS